MKKPDAYKRLQNSQIALPLGHDEDSLARYLEGAVGRPVALTLTDNSRSLLSTKTGEKGLSVRLHKMFLLAGGEVLDELAGYIKGARKDTPLFWRFVRENGHRIKPRTPRLPRKITLRTRGRHHNLSRVFDGLNRQYFGNALGCSITWGARPSRRRVRVRTLGSYSERTDTIRISPVLDRPGVPLYYLSCVVYHEMLHAQLKAEGLGLAHSREFRRRERLFGDYRRAMAWEKR